jgi:hypothetical protein
MQGGKVLSKLKFRSKASRTILLASLILLVGMTLMGVSIALAADAPTGTITINGGDDYTTSTAATLTLTSSATDGQMMISNNANFSGASWEPFSAIKSWTLTGGNGAKTVYAKFKDTYGVESVNAVDDTVYVDTVPPNAYITINEGDYVDSADVTLHIAGDAAYPYAPITQMMISNNANFSGASWESYNGYWCFHLYNEPWTLTSGYGTKTVYFKLKDAAGNVSAVASDSTLYGE